MTDASDPFLDTQPAAIDARARLRSVELRLAATAADLAGRDAQIAGLRRRLEFAEAQARESRDEARRERAATQADRDRLAQEVAVLASRLTEAEQALQHAESGREKLRAALDSARNTEELEMLRANVRRLSAELAEDRAVTRAAEAAAALAPDPEELAARIAAAALQLERMTAERDAVEARARVSRGEHAARIRELEQLVSTLSVTLAATRADIQRAEQSHAWRLGHAAARTASRIGGRRDRTDGALLAALRRIDELEAATRVLPAGPSTEPAPGSAAAAVEPTPEAPPSRTPAEIAAQRRLLAAEVRDRLGPVSELETWPGVSIVVPSRNGRALLETLVAGLREHTDYPLAELIVVDNGSTDDSVGWLGACDAGMPVRTVTNPDNASFADAVNQGAAVAAHGLVLLLNNDVEPFERGWLRELVASHVAGGQALTGATLLHTEDADVRAAAGQLVQHRAIRLRRDRGGVWPHNVGDGEELFAAGFGVEQTVPAVSGACLLVAREQLDELGGLATRYRYGLEDVDLGVRATDAGLRVVASGRVVLYHRESVTRTAEGSEFRAATRTLNRRALLERWGPFLRRAYAADRLTGRGLWTDGAGPHAAIVITSLDASDGWGDWYTGHELGDALGALGWRVSYVARDGEGWTRLPADADYVVTLLDRFDARLVPPEVTVVAWIRNWTDRWLSHPWFSRLDVLLASSATSAALIRERTGREAEVFPLATNPARFAVAAGDGRPTVDCVFTGNHWGEARAIEAGLAPPRGQSLVIRGRGWDAVKPLSRYAQGPATYEELPSLYVSASLALDDTQAPTLRYDAVNARVFDALAAGTLVLTNCTAGVRELFDEDFPTWDTTDDLARERDALLRDHDRRADLTERYRATVLARHTYAHRAHRLSDLLLQREQLPSFCIKIGAPDWEQAERWGDLYFARGIERALRQRGHRVLIQVLEEWEQEQGLSHDVVLHLKGLSRHFPKPGQFNILWCISHPAELTGEECDGYDLVAIASPSFAEEMRPRTKTPVIVLEQATDPAVFYPDPDPARAHDLLYVANSRGVLRPMMRDLLPTDHDLAVYGANWAGLIDLKHVRADHVPNDELRKLYSSAKVVLCDHWDDMREHGFISNRIYDALACGAVVVSDDVKGLKERFGGAAHTYQGAEELADIVMRATGAGASYDAAKQDANTVNPANFGVRLDSLLDAMQHHPR
jgi:GT2 family glycosyltransferase/spore maturation protein CgeB